MKPHNWVAMMMMPVEAALVSAGQVDVSHTELAEELAREDAHVICWACEVVLGPDTLDTECSKMPAKLM